MLLYNIAKFLNWMHIPGKLVCRRPHPPKRLPSIRRVDQLGLRTFLRTHDRASQLAVIACVSCAVSHTQPSNYTLKVSCTCHPECLALLGCSETSRIVYRYRSVSAASTLARSGDGLCDDALRIRLSRSYAGGRQHSTFMVCNGMNSLQTI